MWRNARCYGVLCAKMVCSFGTYYAISPSVAHTRPKELEFGFDAVYIRDTSFAAEKKFQNVTDVAVNHKLGHVFVLQRSQPPVTV